MLGGFFNCCDLFSFNTFIKRVHDCEIIIISDANKHIFTNPTHANDGKSLAEYLVDKTMKYEADPDIHKAIEYLRWINRVYYYGYVKENTESLIKKVKEKEEQIKGFQEQNKNLKYEAEKSATDLVFIQGKYEELDSKFNRMIPKGYETLHE